MRDILMLKMNQGGFQRPLRDSSSACCRCLGIEGVSLGTLPNTGSSPQTAVESREVSSAVFFFWPTLLMQVISWAWVRFWSLLSRGCNGAWALVKLQEMMVGWLGLLSNKFLRRSPYLVMRLAFFSYMVLTSFAGVVSSSSASAGKMDKVIWIE